MTKIHSITHPNKLIQQKVNYFADYYSFVVDQLGKNIDFEIENTLSIIEKIIFQIENNPRIDSRNQYIDIYFKSNFLNINNKYFKEYKIHYPIICKHINKYSELKIKEKNKWIEDNKSILLKDLKRFKTYLIKNMFKKSIKSIISFLKCEHDLSEHIEDLKYYTYVIAVELFFVQGNKNEIKDIFDRIISSDINKFPFNNTISKESKKKKEEFIVNRTFDQQFEGILNYYKSKEIKNYYVFRIGNFQIKEDLVFKIDDIEIYNSEDKKIKKIKEKFKLKSQEYTPDFFNESFKSFVIIKNISKNEKENHKSALKKASKWIENINHNCEMSAFIDKKSYLFTNDFKNFGWSLSFSEEPRIFQKHNLNNITGYQINKFLNNKKIKGKVEFLSNESTYIKAKNNGSLDLYWQYLENLIGKPFKEKLKKFINKEVKENETEFIFEYIRNSFNIFNLNSEISFEINQEEALKIFKTFSDKSKVDLVNIKSKINNPFLNETIEYYFKLEEKNLINYCDYILKILTELQEQRNFIQHGGIEFQKSYYKLINSIPQLIDLFRIKIVNLMIENPDKKLSEILSHNCE
ncbi:Hypothetical protein KQS_09820 [Flavobacterium indicum GPTSA100-9 = DSM 17447]|uniref:Uncharacterized protein n=1 Tax=Flavobacterium indicum (strain DSM 17447 / CIP 109464 / GPTSA100-9) TaxID=1094466 RepID=H8XUW6_FLAIG|nr:hypothetical protein [Flavobacterium indicum]CCG53894.1 Hypothetical protein KQS_09820 [Flavobacterium indicum GPTSA100-9 = DSM 17447]